MAHSISARKRIRQNAKRRLVNRARRATVKGKVKRATTALAKADASTAEKALRETSQLLDREANKGLIHPNAAARRKSRMARKLNALKVKSKS